MSREYLREITNTTRNGVTAYNLIEGARKIGFQADGVSGDLSKINNNNLPCLAHVIIKKNYKHFVVIYDIDMVRKKIVVMDPAKGKVVMPLAEFKLMTTNNYIFLKPIKKLAVLVKKNVVLKVIEKDWKINKKSYIILGILIIFYFILNICVAFHFKYLLNFAVFYNVSENISIISFVIFYAYVLLLLCQYLKNKLLYSISSMIDEQLTLKTLKQILLLPYLYFKNRTTGEVITRLKDLNVVKEYLIRWFNFLMTDVLAIVIFFVFLMSILKKITILVGIIILSLCLLILLRNKRKKILYGVLRRKEERLNSYLVEALSNVDTIKGGHIEKKLIDKSAILYRSLLEKNYKYISFNERSDFLKNLVKNTLLVVIYGIGTYLVIVQKKEIGDILLYQSFLMYFLSSVMSGLNLIGEYEDFKVSLKRVEDLYTIEEEKFLGSYYYYNYKLDGDICFRDLSFKYGYKEILKNINLVIRSGERVLLVGESGSGKSSLVKILMRYLEIPYGMCSIKEIDINHYHLENIRNNISYISSNDYLFTDSLYNNITLGREVLEDEFLRVCRIAMVTEIIEKRRCDYKMLVEENGFNFSNGERQRIILARYLLRNSNIYLFDEALGQIDVEKEEVILKEMFNYLKGKTIIVISHRLNNSSLFDRVLKLDKGNIIEEEI